MFKSALLKKQAGWRTVRKVPGGTIEHNLGEGFYFAPTTSEDAAEWVWLGSEDEGVDAAAANLPTTTKQSAVQDSNSPVVITIEGDVPVAECAGFRYYSAEAETEEDLTNAYSDGTGHIDCKNVYDFIARSFHLIQQTGGELVYEDSNVEAVDMEQTSGLPGSLNGESLIRFGGSEPVSIDTVLKENN